MRLEPAATEEGIIVLDLLLDPAWPEIAIFQTDIDVGRNRVANAGNTLQGDAAILEAAGISIIFEPELAPGKADTRTGIEAEAILIAQVEQQVRHNREIASATIGIDSIADDAVAIVDGCGIFVVRRALVAKLQLGPDHAPVVSEDRIEIVTHLVVDLEVDRGVGSLGSEVDVLGPQKAAFDAQIKSFVARQGRRRDHAAGQ